MPSSAWHTYDRSQGMGRADKLLTSVCTCVYTWGTLIISLVSFLGRPFFRFSTTSAPSMSFLRLARGAVTFCTTLSSLSLLESSLAFQSFSPSVLPLLPSFSLGRGREKESESKTERQNGDVIQFYLV